MNQHERGIYPIHITDNNSISLTISSADEAGALQQYLELVKAIPQIDLASQQTALTVIDHILAPRGKDPHPAFDMLARLQHHWNETTPEEPSIFLDTHSARFRYVHTVDEYVHDIVTVRFDLDAGQAKIVNLSTNNCGIKTILLKSPQYVDDRTRLAQLTGAKWTYDYEHYKPDPAYVIASQSGSAQPNTGYSVRFTDRGRMFAPTINVAQHGQPNSISQHIWASFWGAGTNA